MIRKELTRVYELRDLIANLNHPSAYFQDFDGTIQEPAKKQAWVAWGRVLEELDDDSWTFLKKEVCSLLTAKDAGRGWEQLLAILNQAKGYNYLKGIGCLGLRFIPRAENQRTPDLEGELDGVKVICEVKTIFRSKEEVKARQGGAASGTPVQLVRGFFNKLDSHLKEASTQMADYDPGGEAKRIAYLIINFDDEFGENKQGYYEQIDWHLVEEKPAGIEIVICNQRTVAHMDITMKNATVDNESRAADQYCSWSVGCHMDKPTKVLIFGVIVGALVAGGSLTNSYRLEHKVEELQTRCVAKGEEGSNARREAIDFVLLCDPVQLEHSNTELVGLQGELATAQRKLSQWNRRWEPLLILGGLAITFFFALPWVWYFLLRRIRELREAIIGK